MHCIAAQFGVCVLLDSRDKSSNLFQHVSGFDFKNFRGFCVQIPVNLNLSARLFYCGFRIKLIQVVVPDSTNCSGSLKF